MLWCFAPWTCTCAMCARECGSWVCGCNVAHFALSTSASLFTSYDNKNQEFLLRCILILKAGLLQPVHIIWWGQILSLGKRHSKAASKCTIFTVVEDNVIPIYFQQQQEIWLLWIWIDWFGLRCLQILWLSCETVSGSSIKKKFGPVAIEFVISYIWQFTIWWKILEADTNWGKNWRIYLEVVFNIP